MLELELWSCVAKWLTGRFSSRSWISMLISKDRETAHTASLASSRSSRAEGFGRNPWPQRVVEALWITLFIQVTWILPKTTKRLDVMELRLRRETRATEWQAAASTAVGDSYATAATAGIRYVRNYGSGSVTNVAPMNDTASYPKPANGVWFDKCQLRCHYIHVTGPEATALMNREHVRLMKLMDDTNHLQKTFSIKCTALGSFQTLWRPVDAQCEIRNSHPPFRPNPDLKIDLEVDPDFNPDLRFPSAQCRSRTLEVSGLSVSVRDT